MNIIAISNHLTYIFINQNVGISHVLPGTFRIKFADPGHRINLWRPGSTYNIDMEGYLILLSWIAPLKPTQ